MGSPSPTRLSRQRANDRYRDHLDGQITTHPGSRTCHRGGVEGGSEAASSHLLAQWRSPEIRCGTQELLKLRNIMRDLRGEEKGFGLREPIFKTWVLPASSAFSRSSFKAFAGRWITSPAAIRFTTTFQRPFYFSWHLCSVDNSLSNTCNPIIALPRRAF